MTNTGCKVCGTVFLKGAARTSRLPSRRGGWLKWRGPGPAPGALVQTDCPNTGKHEEILRSKARLNQLGMEAIELTGEGLDIVGSEELSCKIQQARARLRKLWNEKGQAAMSSSGELEEVWDD